MLSPLHRFVPDPPPTFFISMLVFKHMGLPADAFFGQSFTDHSYLKIVIVLTDIPEMKMCRDLATGTGHVIPPPSFW